MVRQDYKNSVLAELKAYGDGHSERLYPNQPDYKERIEAVKLIIDWRQDNDNGFELTFNDTFTLLKKRVLTP